ncbi:bifunctional acetate--CoA ligase family protein/GNAT family N-acetyltransferase [Maridesulfovibrio frigidus]|uniref:bifunctional acetate--CoA ligase family protein/GNAT family N-acetyltransferase n=1 Tax=Maridesulfovibrio frigidus TaxID=340956 RepID=UPI0004E1B9A9|nr:bifunctional acetate--CoA ligase family protein/GNAT family N-acetyltransferase [Maridesulfovibrio frigidus]
MSVVNLEFLFQPRSIAVIGATNEPDNPGNILMRNLMGGGFLGPVMPVSVNVEAISGVLTYKDVDALPKVPDLAIICRPLEECPEILAKLSARGVKASALIGPGFSKMSEDDKIKLSRELMTAANSPHMRILGPKSLGFIIPSLNLNASIAPLPAKAGKIAFVSQSDSFIPTVLDWAHTNDIGFSHVISMGSRIDLTFGDILDYLGSDSQTRSILLYIESINDARDFMSAARAASRNKPVLVIRPGQALQHVTQELSQLGGTMSARSDEVFDVAFRRAGMLRVQTIDGLFDAAQTLASLRQPVRGNRLAIIANGTSAGLTAADGLIRRGGKLAQLSDETITKLDEVFDGAWGKSNPVIIGFDSPGEEYLDAVKVLIKDKGVDAVLVVNVPFAGFSGVKIAETLATGLKKIRRMVLTSWLGSGISRKSRRVFSQAGIPTYDSADQAVRAFMYMAEYQRNQELLTETPDSLPSDFFPDTTTAREIVRKALSEGREDLNDPESHRVLAAYGLPVVETKIAISAREAVIAADELGCPVALKIRSPQISQPYDVGGVVLDLESPEKVWETAATMLTRVNRQRPDAYIEGFTVQKMGRRSRAHELFISASVDPTFGPIIHFGHGGMTREVVRDQAIAMVPLNMSLARELISRTRIFRLLSGTPTQPPIDIEDLCLTLIQVSQLFIDIPQIVNLDINPLYADDTGVLALGAKIRVAECGENCPELAIRPYPRELEECVVLKDNRQVTLRPIRPEDEPAHYAFLAQVSDEDMRMRFFGVVRRDFDHKDMSRFTQINYDREMAFIATAIGSSGLPETLGVVRTSTKPDNSEAEFAIVIRSDLKGSGLGSMLFHKIIRYTRERATHWLVGQTLFENKAMQGLSRKFGFEISENYEEDLVEMRLDCSKEAGSN